MNHKEKLDRILSKVEKPARYIGMEENSVKKDLDQVKVKFAFSYPDVYEVGMSHLGMHILYDLINQEEAYACERVFAPWLDMEEEMRKEGLELISLENKAPIREFDFLGFTLQYELSYSNIVNMLDLANIPILSKDRIEDHPLIIAGGPCAYNPEPLADIIDIFVIGEGEEIVLQLLEIYEKHKDSYNKEAYLKEIVQLRGIYIPSFYDVTYKEDGTIEAMTPNVEEAPAIVDKNYIDDLDSMFSPERLIVPYIETVHDRVVLEIFRGCTHGCRFCQAGMVYRPIREKSPQRLIELAHKLIENTGYENVSLSSLSSCDYSQLQFLVSSLMEDFEEKNVGLSLPSLRLDSFSIDILKEMERVRKSGLTFAPEAGSQRLRNVINKGVSDEDLERAVSYAFKEGWSRIKLYFMIGLPTETDEDVMGIKDLSYKVKDLFFHRPPEERKGNFRLNASASFFVPKPFTPFQWIGQDSKEEHLRKAYLVKNSMKDKRVNFAYHEVEASHIEGALSRGDRRLGQVLIKAWEKGAKYDGWSEHFNYDHYIEAFQELGLDPDFYALRNRPVSEILPWDIINPGVSKRYLIKELEKAMAEESTRDCRLGCTACGIPNCSMRGVFN